MKVKQKKLQKSVQFAFVCVGDMNTWWYPHAITDDLINTSHDVLQKYIVNWYHWLSKWLLILSLRLECTGNQSEK